MRGFRDAGYAVHETGIVDRGVALYGGRVLTSTSVWGEDVLISLDVLRNNAKLDELYRDRRQRAKGRAEQLGRLAALAPSRVDELAALGFELLGRRRPAPPGWLRRRTVQAAQSRQPAKQQNAKNFSFI